MKNSGLIINLLCFCMSTGACAQENIATAGFQYNPIIPGAFSRTGPQTITQNGIGYTITPQFGHSAGMIIRRGMTKLFSFETGINYTRRNYSLAIDTTLTGKSDFTIIGYEIPVKLLIFFRLSENIFMNAGFGISTDMYVSDIQTSDSYFLNISRRHHIFQWAALADLGAEYRSKKSGYFYFGASYHKTGRQLFFT